MAQSLLLLVAGLLVGRAAPWQAAEPWPGAGDGPDFQWTEWEPWVCMCDIGKQGRIRYFVVSTDAEKSNVSLDDFWQVKPCSLVDCTNCKTTECLIPEVGVGAALRFGRRFSRPAADTLRVPHTKSVTTDSYDSLPLIDDLG